MRYALRKVIGAALTLSLILLCDRTVFGSATSSPATVRVAYASGDSELDTLNEGTRFFTDHEWGLQNIPPELLGMTFVRRAGGKPTAVAIDGPASTTVYLLVDSEKGPNGGAELNERLAASGWTRLTDAQYVARGVKKVPIAIYKQNNSSSHQFTLGGAGWSGFVVAASNLELDFNDSSVVNKSKPPPIIRPAHTDLPPDDTAFQGQPVHVSIPQASIKSLEIYQTDSGMMLGQTSEVVLTITRGTTPRETAVQFVTPVGNEMTLARDDALRFIRLTAPAWYVNRAEITFEDKYATHDGGSIGAAIGTMILSVIQGFQIDPDTAITGDIAANGKIIAIGGVSAKIRGAVAGKCSLVAMPAENYDQLVDAFIYNGPSILTDVQVVGISTLNDAVATVRVDRDPKLKQAIDLFTSFQQAAKAQPDYLLTKEAQDKLAKVLELAPQHLSAQILLASAQRKLPRTLSATASTYYTFLAAGPMVGILNERAESRQSHQIPSAMVRTGLIALRKLRPLADANVRPLIDAWARFIEAWDSLQQGSGSRSELETQRQSLLDEMATEQTDAELMQKMMKEGI